MTDINRIPKGTMEKFVKAKLFVYTQPGVAVPNHRYVRPEIKFYNWDEQAKEWIAAYPVEAAR